MPASFHPDKSCKLLLSHESAGGEKGASKPLQTSEVRSRSPIRGKASAIRRVAFRTCNCRRRNDCKYRSVW